MPDLLQSLQGRDLGFLRIVATLWMVDFDAPDARVGMQRLAPALLNSALLRDVLAGLPPNARLALDDLYQHDGRLPWPVFTLRYGEVREMGAGRRDRERPYLKHPSPAEALIYRALAARAFFDAPNGPEEFAYIPDDLLPLLPAPGLQQAAALGRPATPAERAKIVPANDRLLDHACTYLAARRLGFSLEELLALAEVWQKEGPVPLSLEALRALLASAGFLDEAGNLQAEPVRAFLESPPGEALALLVKSWLNSSLSNDLRLVPSLQAEGEWQNDPVTARGAILNHLEVVPGAAAQREAWWSLDAFLAALRQADPHFQRPAGNYDAWYLRDRQSGEFLRGFEHWEDVDGALVRYLVAGPLHWLGILDLAHPTGEAGQRRVTAFRFSTFSADLLKGEAPEGLPAEDAAIILRMDARISVPRRAPRAARYLLSRFCEWEGEKEDGYHYRLTPASLERARQQGLTLSHLLSLLRRHAQPVPPGLVKALERWEAAGTEAHLEQALILRVATPEIMQKLRASRASRFLGDPLGTTAVIVKPGARDKVLLALAELGYLAESRLE